MLNTFLRLLSAIASALMVAACSTTQRPPQPEYHGTVQVMNQEFAVNVDACDNGWLLITTENLYKVTGHGIPTPLYRGVNNVPDALIARRGDTVIATSAKEGLLRSENGGRTFRTVPSSTGLGKPRAITMHRESLIAVDQRGIIRVPSTSTGWTDIPEMDSIISVSTVGESALAIDENGQVHVSSNGRTWTPMLQVAKPTSDSFDWSVFGNVAVLVSDRTLYRIRSVNNALRIDSVSLPDGGWRQVSCYRDDIVLMRGRNEIWWGTFEEPLAVRIPMEGRFDQRVVNMELSSIGLVAGQRGTDHSLWLFIKNATTWTDMRTPDGQQITDVLWIQRADTSMHVGTRDGGLYTLDDARFAMQKIAGSGALANILRHVGHGARSAITLIDGTILRLDSCGAEPRPITPPIPFRNGLQAMEWGERLYVHDAVEGLYASQDGKTGWRRIPLPKEVVNLENVYEIDDRIYVYAQLSLWSTSDVGATWQLCTGEKDTVLSIRSSGKDLLILTDKGWYFVEEGTLGSELKLPTDVRESRSLNFEINGDVIAVFTEKLLYVSNDRGKEWVTYSIAKESPFTEVRIVHDRIFGFVPQTGLLMFDVYDDRPPVTP